MWTLLPLRKLIPDSMACVWGGIILQSCESALSPIKISNINIAEATPNLHVSTILLYCLLNASIEKNFILCSFDVGSPIIFALKFGFVNKQQINSTKYWM